MMMDSKKENLEFDNWIRNGGGKTLESFGVDKFSDLEKKYRDFFKETKLYLEKDNFIFVHAGLDFSSDDIFKNKDAMLWIRDFWVSKEKLKGRKIIHGHTVKPLDRIINQLGSDVINIDGGCVYKNHELYGNLVAIDLTNNRIMSTPNID